MNIRLGFRIALLLALAVCAQLAMSTELALSHATLDRLIALPRGKALAIDAFPVGPTHTATMRFERVQIYSDDAHIYVITAKGQVELPRSKLVFLRGYADDGSARVALAFNPDGSFANGTGSGTEGSFVLRESVDSVGTHKFSAQLEEVTLPKGFTLDFRCGNDKEDLHATSVEGLARQLKIASGGLPAATAAAAHALRFATIAIDTDTAFMANLFSNNTTNATAWIAKMFNTMNLMYERDVLVRLYIGTTILRTVPATDPYAAGGSNPTTNVPADGTDLNNFGNYWQAHEAAVQRSFAVLLSGLGPCNSCGAGCTSCSASGIAWINSYCQNASLGGSYAVVQVFSNIAVDPNAAGAAGLYDHELGHNFGADHTHCTDATAGNWPAASNTIDICYNGEGATHGGGSCYDGATTSCPAGGGTIMSYCHISGCGPNARAFHTTQINAPAPWGLLSRIGAAPVGCLNTTDDIFWDGFDKPGG